MTESLIDKEEQQEGEESDEENEIVNDLTLEEYMLNNKWKYKQT